MFHVIKRQKSKKSLFPGAVISLLVAALFLVPSTFAVDYCTVFNDKRMTQTLSNRGPCGFYNTNFNDAVEACGNEALQIEGPPGTQVQCNFCFRTEIALFENEFGLVALDEITAEPGTPAFRQQALTAASSTVVFKGLNNGNDEPGTTSTVTVDANRAYIFWLVVNNNRAAAIADPNVEVYFSITSANSDAFDHMLSFTSANNGGATVFGWEDLPFGGDNDYEDVVFSTPCEWTKVETCHFGNALRATTGDIRIDPNALVDTYDSCECIYLGRPAGPANVIAGGNINVNQDATVLGDTTPNSPSDPTPFPHPGLTSLGNLEVQSNQVHTLPAGDYLFDNLTVKSNALLKASGGEVRIWVNGRLQLDGEISGDDLRPQNVVLYSTSSTSEFYLNSNCYLYGVIYAPNVKVTLGSNCVVHGSIVGGSIHMTSNAIVHLDAALCTGCPENPELTELPELTNAIEAANGDVVINPNAIINSYDSSVGPYGGSNINSAGNVQASDSITVISATVDGSVTPNYYSDKQSPPIPAGLNSSGVLYINSNQHMVLPAGDYLFDDIFVGSNASLTFTGGVARVWFNGGLEINDNSVVKGDNNDPGNLWFFGQCSPDDVLIKQNNQGILFGVIYAPDLPVTVSSNAVIYGAVIGSSVDVRSNGYIRFDENLGN